MVTVAMLCGCHADGSRATGHCKDRKMATFSRFAQASQRLSCLSMRRGHATFGNTRNFRAQPLRRIATRTVEGTVVEGKAVTKSSEWTSELCTNKRILSLKIHECCSLFFHDYIMQSDVIVTNEVIIN